jgi:2-polyprenyl-6-methoxyphenol hydroxylase-like FAD-dependent oxidoreductase
MNHPNRPLVVGPGPVGPGAALFLARQDQAPRIVEMRNEPSQESKALAVNPRTLDILEPTGVTQRMLDLGLPIHGVRFQRAGQIIASLSLAGIHPRYPFMLALSQATTERLLARALEEAGGAVERGVKLVERRLLADQVEVVLEPSAGGSREVVRCSGTGRCLGLHGTGTDQPSVRI